MHARLLIYAALLGTIALYWAGLRGPFVLDDLFNLEPVQSWLDGQATPLELIFGNSSGVLGRPVSMASFWVTVASGGMHPFPFKFGNLLIHILCGLVGWRMVRHMLAKDPQLASRANLVAAMVAAMWLLHPINVSTVLYAVQRMAQLSTLFTLLAVWMYLLGRQKLVDGETRAALLRLFVGFPLLLVAGLLSKENAAVAPALCLVVELAYYRGDWRRHPTVMKGFYGVFLLLPALAAVALVTLAPDRLFGLYDTRDFTLVERLLSQPRALMEYIGLILWPRGGLMGVFVDDFATSTGLWSPPQTLFALGGLLAISGFAIAVRKRAPSVFAGWFFFLVAHGVESSFLPLELYFEHRNYLPGIGLLIAVVGLWNLLPAATMTRHRYLPLITGLAMAAIFAGLGWVTWGQVQVWRSMDSIVAQALAHRPTSLRATLQKTGMAVGRGDFAQARSLPRKLTDSPVQRNRALGHIHTVTVDCLAGAGGDPAELQKAVAEGVSPVTLAEVQAFGPLSKALREKRCGPEITESLVADTIVEVLKSTTSQPDTSKPKWLMRTTATELYMRADRWQAAQTQAELAWQPGADAAVGGLLTRVYIHNGQKAHAARTLAEVDAHVGDYEIAGTRETARLRALIAAMPDPAQVP